MAIQGTLTTSAYNALMATTTVADSVRGRLGISTGDSMATVATTIAARDGFQLVGIGISSTELTEMFDWITGMDGTLDIWSDDTITEVSLSKLASADRIRLLDNDNLTTVSLPALTRVETELNIRASAITNLNGLSRLEYVNELDLQRNNSLASLSGLVSLDNVFRIFITYSLIADIDVFSSVTTLPRQTLLTGNANLANLNGFSEMTSADYVWANNCGLTSLDGLEKLVTVGDLNFSGNSLTEVDGLAALTHINNAASPGVTTRAALNLTNNSLTNLDGLRNLEEVDTLSLNNNELTNVNGISRDNLAINLNFNMNSSAFNASEFLLQGYELLGCLPNTNYDADIRIGLHADDLTTYVDQWDLAYPSGTDTCPISTGVNIPHTGVSPAVDTTPDSFTFTKVNDAAVATTIESNTVTVDDFDGSLGVFLSGNNTAEFRVNGGAWETLANISAGDTLQLRMMSSPDYETAVSTQVQLGSYSTVWEVSTTMNNTPVVVNALKDTALNVGAMIDIDLSTVFTDPDGHALTYQAHGLPAGLSLATDRLTGELTWASGLGLHTITLVATDTLGASAETQFNLIIGIDAASLGINLSDLEDDIAEAQRDIETIEKSIDDIKDDIKDNADAIKKNSDDISDNATAIDTNKTAIKENKTAIDENETAINTNKDGIKENKDAIAAHETRIEQNKTDISDLTKRVAQNETDISTNKTDISTNASDIANNKTAIQENANAISMNKNNIDLVKTDVASNKDKIAELEAKLEAAPRHYVQETEPTDARKGDLWFKPSNCELKIFTE